MIIQELIGNDLVRTYSDKNVYIHGGFPEADYAEAVDPVGMGRTYTETDRYAYDGETGDGDITDEEVVDILEGISPNAFVLARVGGVARKKWYSAMPEQL